MIRRYSELIRLPTFIERYKYLRLGGQVCDETFGFERYLNQRFYHSSSWRDVRDFVIARDLGCDLAVAGYEIHSNVCIHHMNPATVDDIIIGSDALVDPEFLICTSLRTHNAIHYGDEGLFGDGFAERRPNDTCPWRL